MEEKKACIYFQLSADPAFKAFASGNVLEIEIKPVAEAEKKKKKNEKPKYQVTANAYDDYCEGKLTAGALPLRWTRISATYCLYQALWIQT